jgi:hypothetical protein
MKYVKSNPMAQEEGEALKQALVAEDIWSSSEATRDGKCCVIINEEDRHKALAAATRIRNTTAFSS